MATDITLLYICPHCFSADSAPGHCPHCGQPRVECDARDPDNPCRKPPMDAEGRLLSRAPLWWVVRHAPYLRARYGVMNE
jgi:hypothetical protein